MSLAANLDSAFETLLIKAQRPDLPASTRPVTINFNFGGGGQPILTDPILLVPTGVDPIMVDVPCPLTIVWARMRAMDFLGQPALVADASVDVQISQFATFGSSAPLYGTGFMPQILAGTKADLVLTGWQLNLTQDHTLIATLHSFTGLATAVSLTLLLRPTDVPQDQSLVVSGTTTLTGPNGQVLVIP